MKKAALALIAGVLCPGLSGCAFVLPPEKAADGDEAQLYDAQVYLLPNGSKSAGPAHNHTGSSRITRMRRRDHGTSCGKPFYHYEIPVL